MKAEIRALYRNKRLQLSDDLLASYDKRILSHLMAIPIVRGAFVHVYLPINKWKEFDTFPYIDWLRSERPDVSIVVSKTEFRTGNLKHYRFKEGAAISVNQWGIPELADAEISEPVDPLELDYVLVPLLACDNQGNRIGYGKGFYDRFLLQCRSDVCTIGVSYFPPLEQKIESDPWDISLDVLVYPEGKLFF